MAVIGLSGPHAIGKTTAVRRWLARYPKLLIAVADNQWEETAGGKIRVREWKGTKQEKEQLVKRHQQRHGVTVIDSVRTTHLEYFNLTDPVILVTCSWEVMNRALRKRCEKNNKRFNEECWDKGKLDYESHRRYINFAKKNLDPLQYKYFVINDQARDWPAVDEYFGSIYRKLHNQLNRIRRLEVDHPS